MTAKILIGTSGWGYSDWQARNEKTKIPFYPSSLEERHRLAFYSEIYHTVEINTTFYHYPRENAVLKWEANVPDDFIFAYKIPKLITHNKKLQDDYSHDLHRFLNLMDSGLRKKAGPALLQLPPKFSIKYYKELSIFLGSWPEQLKLAVEFRDISWVTGGGLNQTLSLLENYNVAYCIVDEPLLPPITPITADFTYIRFHGHGLRPWYRYRYSLKELQSWIPKIQKLQKNDQLMEIYTYFNNHPHGSAPANAQQLAILLKMPLKKPESINLSDVRKRAGEDPQLSLESFLDVPKVDIEDFVRYCSHCGNIVLLNDYFCESCGFKLERE